MAAKPSALPVSTEISVKPASEMNPDKRIISDKEKNEERNAPIRNTNAFPAQQPDLNLPASSQSEGTSSKIQRVGDAPANGQSTPVFDNRNPSTSQQKEDLIDEDKSEIKKDQYSPLPKKSESKGGGLQPGLGSEVIANPKPVHKPEKYSLVIIHCFSSSKNTFSYKFNNGTVPQNKKSINDYIEVQNMNEF